MRMLGAGDCANAKEEIETQATNAKRRRSLFKILSPLEQKSACLGAVPTKVLEDAKTAKRVNAS